MPHKRERGHVQDRGQIGLFGREGSVGHRVHVGDGSGKPVGERAVEATRALRRPLSIFSGIATAQPQMAVSNRAVETVPRQSLESALPARTVHVRPQRIANYAGLPQQLPRFS